MHILDVGRPLHDVGVKAARDVPGDMAMEGPDAGVVLLPLEYLSIRERFRLVGGIWLG